MIIAVDFDGTIVEHRYPRIGKEIPFAIQTLKQLTDDKHRLILWTVREGKLLEDAIAFCKERGVSFYAVNQDEPDDIPVKSKHASRKLRADIFIDDRNVGGIPDWGMIYEMIAQRKSYEEVLLRKEEQKGKKKNGFFKRLFGK